MAGIVGNAFGLDHQPTPSAPRFPEGYSGRLRPLGRCDEDDQLGALNLAGPAQVRAAAAADVRGAGTPHVRTDTHPAPDRLRAHELDQLR